MAVHFFSEAPRSLIFCRIWSFLTLHHFFFSPLTLIFFFFGFSYLGCSWILHYADSGVGCLTFALICTLNNPSAVLQYAPRHPCPIIPPPHRARYISRYRNLTSVRGVDVDLYEITPSPCQARENK